MDPQSESDRDMDESAAHIDDKDCATAHAGQMEFAIDIDSIVTAHNQSIEAEVIARQRQETEQAFRSLDQKHRAKVARLSYLAAGLFPLALVGGWHLLLWLGSAMS